MIPLLDLDVVDSVVSFVLMAIGFLSFGLIAISQCGQRATLLEPCWTFGGELICRAEFPRNREERNLLDKRARLLLLGVARAKMRDDWRP
jgi:hypothetical protein